MEKYIMQINTYESKKSENIRIRRAVSPLDGAILNRIYPTLITVYISDARTNH